MDIIYCPKCHDEIAVDNPEHYDIDCDCGEVIAKGHVCSLCKAKLCRPIPSLVPYKCFVAGSTDG